LGPCLLALFLAFLAPNPLIQQDLVREAQRLRDGGQFEAAVKVLDDRLRVAPDDGEAARLRAQTLYWLKDVKRAREAYAAALARHPQDRRTRVEYARMLAETGDRRLARELLEPIVGGQDASADAVTLLGTILYWDGDLTGAQRLFRDALRLGPAEAGPHEDQSQREAARQFREIQMLSASWVRIAPMVWHDDQPLDNVGSTIEAGWVSTPLLSVSARLTPQRYSSGTARTFWTGEAELSHYAPEARIETRIAAGVVRRPGEEQDLDWTTRASVGLRASGGFRLQGRFERKPYLHTLASLGNPLMTKTAAGAVHWSRGPGWLAEAAVQRETFPDANAIDSAYAWILAPIARGSNGQLQAGYAIAAADADEDRFVLADPQQPRPPSNPGFDFAGVYDPYFTPARVLTHSALASLTVGKGSGPLFTAGGSYGFHAREDATTFLALGDQVVSSIDRRGFKPWTARASLAIPASPSVSVNIRGEAGRTSYYQWTTATIEMVYRFLPHPQENPPRR
jgi:Flp pilus assembly protein TadD